MNTLYTIAATESAAKTEIYKTVEETNTEHTETEPKTHATTESTSHGSSEEAQGIAALGIDPYAIGAQLVTFLLLFWVIKRFALEKIVKNLDKRYKEINRGLKLTAELDEQKVQFDEQVEKLLAKARKEADGIISQAQTESHSVIKKAEETAQIRAEEIIKAAEGKIEREIIQARSGLKTEMVQLITEATEAILDQKLDQQSDRKLVERYLTEALEK